MASAAPLMTGTDTCSFVWYAVLRCSLSVKKGVRAVGISGYQPGCQPGFQPGVGLGHVLSNSQPGLGLDAAVQIRLTMGQRLNT